MKQTKKLGRGLEDFSHLFLSSPDEGKETERPAGATGKARARTICIAGERGVGEKAFLTVMLAGTFTGQGKKVVVFDADFSLPRLCMLMGSVPSNSLLHLIMNPGRTGASLRESGGVTLITLDVDVATLTSLTDRERLSLTAAVRRRMEEADAVLVITSGDSINHMRVFIQSADDIVVVAPQPVAETINAYGVVKKIFQLDDHARVGIVASRNSRFDQAEAVFEKMQRVARKFLNKPLLNHGYLPDDKAITAFLERDNATAVTAPSAETTRCLAAIAGSLWAGDMETTVPADHALTLAEKLFACPVPPSP